MANQEVGFLAFFFSLQRQKTFPEKVWWISPILKLKTLLPVCLRRAFRHWCLPLEAQSPW